MNHGAFWQFMGLQIQKFRCQKENKHQDCLPEYLITSFWDSYSPFSSRGERSALYSFACQVWSWFDHSSLFIKTESSYRLFFLPAVWGKKPSFETSMYFKGCMVFLNLSSSFRGLEKNNCFILSVSADTSDVMKQFWGLGNSCVSGHTDIATESSEIWRRLLSFLWVVVAMFQNAWTT